LFKCSSMEMTFFKAVAFVPGAVACKPAHPAHPRRFTVFFVASSLRELPPSRPVPPADSAKEITPDWRQHRPSRVISSCDKMLPNPLLERLFACYTESKS
jgi:hypothetical protein